MVAKARAVVATERTVGPVDRAARAATAMVGEGMEVERVSAVAGRARTGAVKVVMLGAEARAGAARAAAARAFAARVRGRWTAP